MIDPLWVKMDSAETEDLANTTTPGFSTSVKSVKASGGAPVERILRRRIGKKISVALRTSVP